MTCAGQLQAPLYRHMFSDCLEAIMHSSSSQISSNLQNVFFGSGEMSFQDISPLPEIVQLMP